MTIGRRSWYTLILVAIVPGCAGTGSGSGTLFSRSASNSSLKTSLSHLEYENRQLKNNVAKLDADNREIENRLVQEESANGELSARLDDARTLLSQREDAGTGPDANSSKLLPAGQSNKKRRKPPFAQIPGRIDTISPEEEPEPPTRGGRSQNLFGPQSRADSPFQWFPIAEGTGAPAVPRR